MSHIESVAPAQLLVQPALRFVPCGSDDYKVRLLVHHLADLRDRLKASYVASDRVRCVGLLNFNRMCYLPARAASRPRVTFFFTFAHWSSMGTLSLNCMQSLRKSHLPGPCLLLRAFLFFQHQPVSRVSPRGIVSLGKNYVLCMVGAVFPGQAQSWLD